MVRVVPPDDHPALFRHEHRLLRREFTVQPFLAPLDPLLPDIVFVDFTQQLVARDYLVQTWIDGDVWQAIKAELAPTEQATLWQQLGALTRQIHAVEQAAFGSPLAVPGFARWSDVLLTDLAAAQLDFAAWRLPTDTLATVYAFVARQRTLFDGMSAAHLLHGDLWRNNILIVRTADGPRIAGVLDAGFAEWGDPAADWTLMRMALTPVPGADTFWDGYGRLASDPEATRRTMVYQMRMLAWAGLELTRREHPNAPAVLEQLASLSKRLDEEGRQ